MNVTPPPTEKFLIAPLSLVQTTFSRSHKFKQISLTESGWGIRDVQQAPHFRSEA